MNGTQLVTTSPMLPAVQSSPQQMAVRLANMKEMARQTHDFFREVMVPSTPGTADGDYGVIPGTDKPTLLKPGAEKLCGFYGYAITIDPDRSKEIVDYETGFMRVVTIVRLIDKHTGEIAGEGVGECNTKEARYARRWVFDSEIPDGVDPRSLKQMTRTGRNNKPYTKYLIENDDPFTLWNTVKKMSKKRALVDGTLSATCASQIFTQGTDKLKDWIDAEFRDIEDDDDEPPPAKPAPAAQAARQPSQPAPAPTDTAAPQAPGFWARIDALGLGRDVVEAESQRLFQNKIPSQLDSTQRRTLVDFLEAKVKGAPAEAEPDLPFEG